MGDQRRMAAGDVHAMSLVNVQFRHRLGYRRADADALVVGQGDDAADSPAILLSDQRHGGAERDRRARPQRQVAAGILRQRPA